MLGALLGRIGVDRNQRFAVRTTEAFARNVAKARLVVLREEVLGHLRVWRVRVRIADEEEEGLRSGRCVRVVITQKAQRLVRQHRRLKAFVRLQ